MTQNIQNTTETEEMSHPIQSKAVLIRATLLAAALAFFCLIFAILPAEYGIDPSGVGQRLGLTKLSEIEADGGTEAASPVTTDNAEGSSYREDTKTITVQPGAGLEYKFHLLSGDAMKFNWGTSGGELFFDFHGEPKGDKTGFFESYAVSTSKAVRGTFTAPFTGSHGWYWKNKGHNPVVITLKTGGSYEVIGLK